MKLKDIFKDIYKGLRIENDNSLEAIDAYLIDTKDVENCVINYSNSGVQKIKMNIKDKYLLKPNDIIIASIPSKNTNHVGYCSSLNNDKVIIKKNFFVLRNPYDNNLYNLEFIAEYLEYFGINQIMERKSREEGLVLWDIEEIEIPLVPIDKQNELIDIIRPINERNRLYQKLIKNDESIKKYMINEVIKDEK